ncbi:MAG TPA: S9 family peptidase [Candidatus Baltobacteraceae bacterium]|nr:S9 family peptidase [Candidatus Baltobacteraceae bacterium]
MNGVRASAATRAAACASAVACLSLPVAAPAAAPVTATPSPAAATLKPLTFEALRNLAGIEDAQIAPDGTRVAYVRTHGDYKADERATEIELVDVANGSVRALTHDRHGISEIRWSPNGDRLAFLASPERDKPPEIFVLPMDGGDALQVTSVKAGVSDFAWRPDGGGFAFAARDLPKPPKPKGYVPAFYVTDEHYLTREETVPVAVWTVQADGSKPKRLTTGKASVADYFSELQYTPDGKTIVATMGPDALLAHLSKAQTDRIDVVSGAMVPIANGPDTGGTLSHDGTKIALSWPRHGSAFLQHDVSVRSLAGGAEIVSGKGIDRNVAWTRWAPDDKALYVGAHDGVRSVMWRLAADGSSQRVDLGDVDVAEPVSIASNGTMAFVGVSRTDPGDIYVVRGGGAPQQLTHENAWLSGYALAKREAITWQSDGLTVDGVLTYPIGFKPGRTYPLVLNIHGGPVSTSTWDFNRYDSGLVQVLAAHGYLVLEPNYRGSDNAGDAFLQAIVPHVASGPGRDNLRGVQAVEAMGIIDRSRIGVGGWSGGGLQTSWLVGHAHFWRAAVSGAGVDNWFEQAVLSDINEEFTSTFLGGATPWTKTGKQFFDEESPLTYASHIATPLLILSDIGDQRVPITQSFELYRALHDNGKTVEFMAWPREGHFPSDPVARESIMKAWAGWFERWLK